MELFSKFFIWTFSHTARASVLFRIYLSTELPPKYSYSGNPSGQTCLQSTKTVHILKMKMTRSIAMSSQKKKHLLPTILPASRLCRRPHDRRQMHLMLITERKEHLLSKNSSTLWRESGTESQIIGYKERGNSSFNRCILHIQGRVGCFRSLFPLEYLYCFIFIVNILPSTPAPFFQGSNHCSGSYLTSHLWIS